MVKIIVLLTVLSLKIVSIQSEQFGLFPGILGEPRRLRWHPYFEPQMNVMMQINEKMLKTIRFKSSLCQKLEAELREKEDEIINTKTENFKLEKTVEFLQTNQNQQSQESEKDDSNTTKNLEARLEYLEQMVSESKTEVISSSMAKFEMAKKTPLNIVKR